jgi:uncharacterized protein (TIGR04255 family)
MDTSKRLRVDCDLVEDGATHTQQHRRPAIPTPPRPEKTIDTDGSTDSSYDTHNGQDATTIDDTPYGGLPWAERTLLRRHHIELAVAEVRFGGAEPLTAEHGLALREAAERAGFALPHVEETQRQDVAFTLTPHGPATTQQVDRGWLLTSGDRSATVTIFHDVLIVQHSRYTRFRDSLRLALEAMLPALQTHLAPAFVQRVGLRYVNRLSDPEATHPTAWRGRITPTVLGVIEHDILGGAVASTQQQIELALEDAGALIRHGTFRDAAAQGGYSYLLDIDVFTSGTERFDPLRTVQLARKLNRTALTLFQQVVLSDYRDTMQPYATTEDEG